MLREHQEPGPPEELDELAPEYLDQTPPPDHEDFLAVRAIGLRELKENLATRRR